MNKLLILLVVAVCVPAAIGKQQDLIFPRLNRQDNLRFTFGNSDYEVSVNGETWEVAKYYCKLIGMELVSIETEEEQNAIIEATMKAADFLFWISLNDHFNPNSFIWESTGEFAESYTNWIGGKPNPPTEDNNCCVLELPDFNRKWSNERCALELRYICEKRRTVCK